MNTCYVSAADNLLSSRLLLHWASPPRSSAQNMMNSITQAKRAAGNMLTTSGSGLLKKPDRQVIFFSENKICHGASDHNSLDLVIFSPRFHLTYCPFIHRPFSIVSDEVICFIYPINIVIKIIR